MKTSFPLHPSTKKYAESFANHPGHSLIIDGPTGIGKYELAIHLCELVLETENLQSYPYHFLINGRDQIIGIDQARELKQFLKHKVPRAGALNQVVVIRDAQNMTTEAQNALLKTFEEPPAGTLIVLTTNSTNDLLPTIQSRSQRISMTKPLLTELKQYLTGTLDQTADIDLLVSISGGLPILAKQLAADPDHPLYLARLQLKAILAANLYDRLLMVDGLTKDRPALQNLFEIAKRMARTAIKHNTANVAGWLRVEKAAYSALQAINSNTNSKLVLSEFMLNL